MSVGIELVNEIERITAKRERWRSYQAAMPAGERRFLEPGIIVMTAEIEEAKAALHGDDPVRAMRALEALKNYSNDD